MPTRRLSLPAPPRALRRTLAAVAAAVSLATALAGPAGAGTEPDGPDYGKPSVGECRALTAEQAYKNSDPTSPIDCAEAHTTRVIAVVRLPQTLTWNSSTEKIQRAIVRKCLPILDETLGRTAKVRDQSAYSWLWFIPTKAQRSHGARWIRCDVALFGGTKLVALPSDETPALVGNPPLPDRVARCLAPTTLITTTCKRAHTFRATGAFTLQSDRYPSEQRFRNAALERCPALVSSASFRWSWRSEEAWKLGNHTVVCYTKTRR